MLKYTISIGTIALCFYFANAFVIPKANNAKSQLFRTYYISSSSSSSSTSSSTTKRTTQLQQTSEKGNNNRRTELIDNNDVVDTIKTTTNKSNNRNGDIINGRRVFLLSTMATTVGSTSLLFGNPDEANAAFTLPFMPGEPRRTSLSVISNRVNSTSATAMRQPTKEPAYDKDLAAESCLLELLPTKNKPFRTLEKELLKVSILRDAGNGMLLSFFFSLSLILLFV